MVKCYCDKCGAEVPSEMIADLYESKYIENVRVSFSRNVESMGYESFRLLLCADCLKWLNDTLQPTEGKK